MRKAPEQGMSLIVKTVTRLTVGLILLYGVYIVSQGHLSSGGGFAGGVMIALSFVHLMLAFGKETAFKKLSEAKALFFESLGVLIFLGIALLGLVGGVFFLNFLPPGEAFRLFSGGTIPFSNIAISLNVGAGLFTVFLAIVLLNNDSERK
jgi:multicomponent Na+:H+ antiporter subunit B